MLQPEQLNCVRCGGHCERLAAWRLHVVLCNVTGSAMLQEWLCVAHGLKCSSLPLKAMRKREPFQSDGAERMSALHENRAPASAFAVVKWPPVPNTAQAAQRHPAKCCQPTS